MTNRGDGLPSPGVVPDGNRTALLPHLRDNPDNTGLRMICIFLKGVFLNLGFTQVASLCHKVRGWRPRDIGDASRYQIGSCKPMSKRDFVSVRVRHNAFQPDLNAVTFLPVSAEAVRRMHVKDGCRFGYLAGHTSSVSAAELLPAHALRAASGSQAAAGSCSTVARSAFGGYQSPSVLLLRIILAPILIGCDAVQSRHSRSNTHPAIRTPFRAALDDIQTVSILQTQICTPLRWWRAVRDGFPGSNSPAISTSEPRFFHCLGQGASRKVVVVQRECSVAPMSFPLRPRGFPRSSQRSLIAI